MHTHSHTEINKHICTFKEQIKEIEREKEKERLGKKEGKRKRERKMEGKSEACKKMSHVTQISVCCILTQKT